MRVLFGIALAAVAVALTPVAGAQTVTECDRLASHPEDPDRVAPAVETSDLQFDAAIAACRADIVREPDNSRLHYLLGRLLFYNKQNEEAVKEVRNAADMGYRQAQFVFGAFINNKRPFAPTDICVLEDYWLKSAIAGRQAARISYVRYALRGKFDGCAHQPDRATLTSLLDAAHVGKPGYYEKLVLEDIDAAMAQSSLK